MNYQLSGDIAVLHFDDGKVNAVGHDFVDAMNEGLDRASAEAKAVIVRGREGTFSAGFDLKEFQKGPEASAALACKGFELFTRMYGHPQPLLVACTGHAVAAGAFMLLAADNRVGIAGDYRFCLPETAISMDIPPLLRELTVTRISPNYLTQAFIQSLDFDPQGALEAGFLDEVVDLQALEARVMELAEKMAALPAKYYDRNKQSLRGDSLRLMRSEVESFKQRAGL